MEDGLLRPNNFDVDRFTLDRNGLNFNIVCKKCKHYLTTVKVNDFCIMDIDVECSACHEVGHLRNVKADKPVKIDLGRPPV